METKRLNPDERVKVVEMYQNGYTIAQLTREYKISRPTVYKILSKVNLNPTKNEFVDENKKLNKEIMETAKINFLGVTIDTINGSSDPRIKKALKRSASLLDILEFIKVTKFTLNMVMFDYFWQVVVGKRCGHVAAPVLEWFGYEGDFRDQKQSFIKMLKRNSIEYREVCQNDKEIELYPTIQDELAIINEGAQSLAKFLIMEPNDLKMAIMQLKTKNGHVIRQYYIDLEDLLKLYVEYTLYFNHRESQRKITNLEQMMANMSLERQKDREIMLRQEQYMRSLGISLEEVKDQNEDLLDKNEELLGKTKGLEKQNKTIQRKLGIAVVDRAPQPEDESKRERFVLIKRNDSDYLPYHVIRAQDSYTKRKLKAEQLHFPDSKILLDFKCSPNSKTFYVRIKENLKEKGVVFKNNNIDLEDTEITEQDLIDELKVINDEKLEV